MNSSALAYQRSLACSYSPLLAQPQQPGSQLAPTTAAPASPPAIPTATAPATDVTGQVPNSAAPAAATQQPDELGDEEEIVVTGARARGAVVGDIPPENTLDARDVRATGATNIPELLDALAPHIGSSRRRGGEAPVLLLNGRDFRFRELRDIRQKPSSVSTSCPVALRGYRGSGREHSPSAALPVDHRAGRRARHRGRWQTAPATSPVSSFNVTAALP
jgi:hypothetical protein